jgi:hypothetical protein
MFTNTARRFRLLASAGAVMFAFAIGAPHALADPSGQPRIREQLGEIGAWAVPSTSKEKPRVSESQQAIVREKLEEIGAWAVPTTSTEKPLASEKLAGLNLFAPTTSLASSSEGFEWGDAAIGAGAVAALCAAAAAVVAVRKRTSPAQ